MSSNVEHNDVDIAGLFAWSKKFEVTDDHDEVLGEFYIRLLGDADNARARVYALRQSADLRARLRDKESDDYVLSLGDIEQLSRERLAQLMVVLSLRDISQRAVREVKIKEPKEPKSDAKTEDQEKYQLELDAYPDKRDKALRAFVEKESEKLEKDLTTLDEDRLRKMVVQAMINELCEDELLRSYRNMSAYLGSYKDEALKERLFASYEDFNNLPVYVKQQFLSSYQMLEMSGDDLKKLRAATQ